MKKAPIASPLPSYYEEDIETIPNTNLDSHLKRTSMQNAKSSDDDTSNGGIQAVDHAPNVLATNGVTSPNANKLHSSKDATNSGIDTTLTRFDNRKLDDVHKPHFESISDGAHKADATIQHRSNEHYRAKDNDITNTTNSHQETTRPQLASIRNWELCQLDVHNAFLHGDLDEEVYMQLPLGYGNKGEQRQSLCDYSLFTYRQGNNFLAVLVYVDDLMIAGNNSTLCQHLKDFLNSQFHIKDLGRLKYFLDIEVARHPSRIFLCQRKYTLDILFESEMLGAKPVSFPMEQKLKLTLDGGSPLPNPMQYRRLVGQLIYLTITRPEISFSVHILSQFMQAPTQLHLDATMRVLCYLKSSPRQGIFLSSSSSLQLSGFCDSDWASCPTTRRSTTGYVTMLGTSPISWKTKKQSTVSCSSTEAEYRAMASIAMLRVTMTNVAQEDLLVSS
ncbi:hypothetical protein SLEP1_g45363 [Rubroshorea leprosula]|uniref:Reverse transcriptase Ty1/copia-type domain-containing protein n=1 Tax=Rubroshorea leprosula TaxID=152421 RepID=A0AAV5LKG9_9ROSI|nr:hypothetical protein SLEP1_g45363 [Rubroshorea leprosula]